MSITTELGQQIKKFRKACNLTQEELAEKIGVESPSFVSKIETGQASASYDLLGRIAAIFGIKIKELFDIKTLDVLKTTKPTDKWENKINILLSKRNERELKKAYIVLKALFK